MADENNVACSSEDIDIDALYNLTDNALSAASTVPLFYPGDHVWMWCEAAGGVKYQHHGIVLYANNNNKRSSGQKHLLKVADFTAPNNGTFAIPDSIASGSAMDANYCLPHWHGVRVTTYDNVEEWHREEYTDENCADDAEVVLQRVKFLLSNPHLIPKYDLLESNCETVAVWCKTGTFRTYQITDLVNGGKRNSAKVAASSVVASTLLGPLVLPAIAGAAISFSTLLAKENSNERKWKERTKILNDEFQRWQDGQDQVCNIM